MAVAANTRALYLLGTRGREIVMNYMFVGLLIAIGLLLLEPGLAPLAIRFKLLVLSTFCVLTYLVAEYRSAR